MFDLTPFQPWHLYLFLGVFIVTTFAIRQKVIHATHGQSVPAAGFIILVACLVPALIIIHHPWQAAGLAIAAIIIAFVGRADEVKPLAAHTQWIWQVIIASIAVVFGWTIPFVTNPVAGGVVSLSWITIGSVLIPGSILALLWILFLINAINWIDGLDGLAGSIACITCIALVAVSLLPATQDSMTLMLALIGVAAMAGFLVWNMPPAKTYLGTIGSWFIGLYIALVAMHGGGKIITTALVLALPTLDTLFVIAARIVRRQPPWQGDTISHLHHRLLAAGIAPAHITAAAVVVTITLAAASVLLSTSAKIIMLAVVAVGFIIAFIGTIPHQAT